MHDIAQSTWVTLHALAGKALHPCHGDNIPFDAALAAFRARAVRFRATLGSPRAGRQFALKLPSGRLALLTNYDDFPLWLEISLELEERPDGEGVVYYQDLASVLEPLGLVVTDKSNVGFPTWR
jgi:hypothetical protein